MPSMVGGSDCKLRDHLSRQYKKPLCACLSQFGVSPWGARWWPKVVCVMAFAQKGRDLQPNWDIQTHAALLRCRWPRSLATPSFAHRDDQICFLLTEAAPGNPRKTAATQTQDTQKKQKTPWAKKILGRGWRSSSAFLFTFLCPTMVFCFSCAIYHTFSINGINL